MATYTTIADSNGDFEVDFGTEYNSGEKITVTAEKDLATKSIELYAPSGVVGGSIISFDGNGTSFPNNIGVATVSGINGTIPDYCFASASLSIQCIFNKASGLIIDEGVVQIRAFSFQYWESASFVDLPSTLTYIDGFSFQWLTSCNFIYIRATTPPTLQNVNAFYQLKSTCKFKVPAASVSAYQAATNWSTFAARIEAI